MLYRKYCFSSSFCSVLLISSNQFVHIATLLFEFDFFLFETIMQVRGLREHDGDVEARTGRISESKETQTLQATPARGKLSTQQMLHLQWVTKLYKLVIQAEQVSSGSGCPVRCPHIDSKPERTSQGYSDSMFLA